MKDHNDIEVIVNNQRIIMIALAELMKANDATDIAILNERLDYLAERESIRFK